MPIYVYVCKKCRNKFERLEGIVSEVEELKCPACGSKKAERIFSTFSVGKSSSGSSDMPPPACSSCPGNCKLT